MYGGNIYSCKKCEKENLVVSQKWCTFASEIRNDITYEYKEKSSGGGLPGEDP